MKKNIISKNIFTDNSLIVDNISNDDDNDSNNVEFLQKQNNTTFINESSPRVTPSNHSSYFKEIIHNINKNKNKRKSNNNPAGKSNNTPPYQTKLIIDNKKFIGDFSKIKLLNVLGSDLEIDNPLVRLVDDGVEKTIDNNTNKNNLNNLLINNNLKSFHHSYLKIYFKLPLFQKLQIINNHNNNFYDINFENLFNYIPYFYLPNFLYQKTNNNNLVNIPIDNNEYCLNLIKNHYDKTFELYKILLKNNVSNQQAIMILPISVYSESIYTDSFFNLSNLYNDNKYNKNICDINSVIFNILKKAFPNAFAALLNSFF
tara:strand:- start:68 stop:1012 length:945 start_codon:yes stop_codon:yes gene_type:complete